MATPPPPPPDANPPSPLSQRVSTPPNPNPNLSPARNTRNPYLSSSMGASSRPPRPQPLQRNLSTQSSQSSQGGGERRRSYNISPEQYTQFQFSNVPTQLDQPSLSGDVDVAGDQYTQADANLLMASLERPAVEDQAESTLLEVLERRHVTFANQSNRPSLGHRRNRTDAQLTLNQDDQFRGSVQSNEYSGLQLRRPLLVSRAASLGKSRRNLGNLPALRTASRSYDANDEIFQSLSDAGGKSTTTEESGAMSGLGNDNQQNAPPAVPPRLGLTRAPSYKMHYRPNINKHRRGASALPKASELGSINVGDNIPESAKSSISGVTGVSNQIPSGFSSLRDRVKFVAMAMKNANPETSVTSRNMQDSNSFTDDGNLADLVNIVKAKRDEEESRESSGLVSGSRGAGSRGGGSRGSAGSRGRKSGIASGNESASGSQSGSYGGSSRFSGHRRGRNKKPFAEVSSPWARDNGPLSNIDNLFEVAEQVQELFELPEIPEGDEDDFLSAGQITGSMRSADLAAENAAFLNQLAESHPEIVEEIEEDAGGDIEALPPDEQTPFIRKARMKRMQVVGGGGGQWLITQSMRKGRLQKFYRWLAYVRRQLQILAMAFDASEVKEAAWSYFQNQVSFFIIPAVALAAFSYYRLGNPSFEFLPTDASISWLVLFSVRSYLTLTLAYITEYFFVDILATRSPLSVKVIGPLATLYTINAKGWPFLVTMWGVWNFILMHGSAPYNESWLYFTDIEMFSDNRDDGISNSELYKEVLLSMVLAGVATSIKRTILALYLGKRVYIHYKPKLEKLMVDMLLLTEVAELGNALDDFEFERVDAPEDGDIPRDEKKSLKISEAFRTSTMQDLVQRQKKDKDESDDEPTDDNKIESVGEQKGITSWNRLRTLSNGSEAERNMDKAVDEEETTTETSPPPGRPSVETKSIDSDFSETETSKVSKPTRSSPEKADEPPPMFTQENEVYINDLPELENVEPPVSTIQEPVQGVLRQASTTVQIKSLLDRWEEPVNKMDKEEDPSIHEILQFRKALSFLDDTHPFSLSFGPANTRDLCIKSAKNLYKRLLGFSPGSNVLHFDVLGVLAYEADGQFDEHKAKGMVRLFRPDKFDEVSLLAFVQSCDGVYKKLRYLRASVGNSTLIDYVLENIFNAFFYFFLALAIMSVLKLNPWTLLVSLSTILVSFAFAVGPSAAKLIAGMMMIAIRRPYDLGDRISIVDITGKPDPDDPGYRDTWLVEDVNLFTTTLRLSRTNEVSSCNNGSLADTRIVNHNRSNNASVTILLPMKLSSTHDEVQVVKSAIEQYIQDNPRIWACLVNFRVAKVDPNMEMIVYSAKLQHVKNWQDLLPILQNKGDLEKFCTEILMQLGIQYDSPHSNTNIYVKEMLEQVPTEALGMET